MPFAMRLSVNPCSNETAIALIRGLKEAPEGSYEKSLFNN